MKSIIKIFKYDLKKISKSIVVFIVIIGISILPALYAWFNIAANWDPYSNTGDIPFAVCSKDKGYSYKNISINAGNKITDKLKQNDNMGWTFVSEDEALKGVENGDYYAAVIIPENFSENLCSLVTGKFNQAEIKYYVNEKKNAIAPKITDKGSSSIEEQVKSTFVETITTVIATALNITSSELSGNKTELADKITSSLDDIKDEINTFQSGISVFNSTLDTVKNLLKTNQNALPKISETLSKSGVITSSVKDAIDSTRSASSKLTDSLSDILSSTKSMEENISSQVKAAFDSIETDSAAAAEKLVSVTEINNKIIGINNKIISTLEDFGKTFSIDTTEIVSKFKRANEKQQDTINKIKSAADTIKKTGKLPTSVQQEILSLINDANSEISSLESAFSAVKSKLNKTVDSVYSTLEDASGLLAIINGDIPDIDKTLDSAGDSLDEMKKTFNGVSKLMDNSIKKIDSLKTKVQDLKDNNTIENFVSTIIERPNDLGKFVSSPVSINTDKVYPVENYGSGMTPFYTTLAFWVGGIILVAVMKSDLSSKDLRNVGKAGPAQQFFGRYILFFLIGQIQALITALGDIFFLNVQCENPGLFILASLISSFVYTLIIYSLTITFSVIGKALAVIILVIQIAGSGGTFPVEVLPQAFRNISPYLPFRYGINALRECVAGVDYGAFWTNIMYMLAFVPFALVMGLLLRKPCIKVICFFNRRVEESDIIL